MDTQPWLVPKASCTRGDMPGIGAEVVGPSVPAETKRCTEDFCDSQPSAPVGREIMGGEQATLTGSTAAVPPAENCRTGDAAVPPAENCRTGEQTRRTGGSPPLECLRGSGRITETRGGCCRCCCCCCCCCGPMTVVAGARLVREPCRGSVRSSSLRCFRVSAAASSQAARRNASSSCKASPLFMAKLCMSVMTSHFSSFTFSNICPTRARSSRSSRKRAATSGSSLSPSGCKVRSSETSSRN
mmetsp:Transcript_46572/g.107536  ORF Transcript_46572/g.107536 Transcript_46572/m.107536 type:complete len:243 (+) Transcript_46572:113-841(+)